MVSDTSSHNLSLGVVKKALLLGVILKVADAPEGYFVVIAAVLLQLAETISWIIRLFTIPISNW